MNFYHWLIQNKNLSKATALKYDLVIKNRINEWLPSYELPQNSIEFEALKQTIFTLDIYQDRNRVGNNMYSSALKHYGDFLKEIDVNDGSIFTEKQIFPSAFTPGKDLLMFLTSSAVSCVMTFFRC